MSANEPVAASVTDGEDFETFWDGQVRQTTNRHTQDERPVFGLAELLSPKEEIEFAIMSAYCWDFDWMYDFVGRKTPVIAVDHDPNANASISTIKPGWIRTTPSRPGKYGRMHMKFMLLFFPSGRLRVVVSSANLVPNDWCDIENTVWVQDIPKRPSPIAAHTGAENFASTLVRVLHGVNIDAAHRRVLDEHPNIPLQRLEDLCTHWDFSRVNARLIPSIAGTHKGWKNVTLNGHPCLMQSLKDMGVATPPGKELDLECHTSSIGTYSKAWLNEFYRSARGVSGKAARANQPWPPVKILFPTVEYVRESVLGEPGAGTMFCKREQWEGEKFPRELFHQSKSKRGPILSHSKVVLGTFGGKRDKNSQTPGPTSPDREHGVENEASGGPAAWAYVGSHNFAPSAWGRLLGSAFNPRLCISNYELGVLLPLHSEEEIENVACWTRPPLKYIIGRDKPWMQFEPWGLPEDELPDSDGLPPI